MHVAVRRFAVINQVGAISLGARLNCDAFADSHSSTAHYDPKSFVGMPWRPMSESICAEVYSTGKAKCVRAYPIHTNTPQTSQFASFVASYRSTNRLCAAVCPARAGSVSCCARSRGWHLSCCGTRQTLSSPTALQSTCAAPIDRTSAHVRRRAHRWSWHRRECAPKLLHLRCPSRSHHSGRATPHLSTPTNADQSACDRQLSQQTRTKKTRSESYLKDFKFTNGCVQTACCSRASPLSRGCAAPAHLRRPFAPASKRVRGRDQGASAT